MFLPVGDTPNPINYRPWINWTLIAINVAVYVLITLPLSGQPIDPNDPLLAQYLQIIREHLPPGVPIEQVIASISQYDLFVLQHGYQPGARSFVDLWSSMFLHDGFMHLAGNMLFLWIYGDNCEHRLGRLLYLIVYLSTGAIATLTFAAFAGSSLVPLIGASGAISGVLGLYFLMFPRNSVKVLVLLFPLFFNTILLPARLVLAFFVVVDNLLPVLFSSQTGVAYGAHLGGFFAGLAVAWVGERIGWKLGRNEPYRPHRPIRSRVANTIDVQQAISRGDRETALKAFSQAGGMLAASLNPMACAQLAEWLIESGAPISANDLLRRCLAQHRGASGPGIGRIFLAMGLLRLAGGQTPAAYQWLLGVFDHDPDPETAQRAKNALAQIDVYQRRVR